MLVRWDVVFLDVIVNLSSSQAPQSYTKPFLSFIDAKIYQAPKMLKMVVQVGLCKVKPTKKPYRKIFWCGPSNTQVSFWYDKSMRSMEERVFCIPWESLRGFILQVKGKGIFEIRRILVNLARNDRAYQQVIRGFSICRDIHFILIEIMSLC